jgi:hypothetical protein
MRVVEQDGRRIARMYLILPANEDPGTIPDWEVVFQLADSSFGGEVSIRILFVVHSEVQYFSSAGGKQ